MRRFEGRRVIITGGANGIGKATVARFASNGVAVVLEVASVIAFLASDDASFVHGDAILIDGGQLAD